MENRGINVIDGIVQSVDLDFFFHLPLSNSGLGNSRDLLASYRHGFFPCIGQHNVFPVKGKAIPVVFIIDGFCRILGLLCWAKTRSL